MWGGVGGRGEETATLYLVSEVSIEFANETVY